MPQAFETSSIAIRFVWSNGRKELLNYCLSPIWKSALLFKEQAARRSFRPTRSVESNV